MQPQPADVTTPAPAAARHAQVVPSFVLPSLSRTLECWAGTVSPGELVRWERAADLAESARRELRIAVIRRLRPRSDWLWAQTIGVRLADGWRNRLLASDTRGIDAILTRYPDKPIEQLTLGEFRQGFGTTLERQLAVLARLEAMYWSPPPRPAQRPRVFVAPQSAAPVPPAEVQALADRVLALPWVAKVSPKDLRFGIRLSLYKDPPLPGFILKQIYREFAEPYRAAQITLIKDLMAHEARFVHKRYDWKMPVYLIWGERDELIPNATGRAVLARNELPEDHWIVIPKTGHVANIEKPKEFDRVLREILLK